MHLHHHNYHFEWSNWYFIKATVANNTNMEEPFLDLVLKIYKNQRWHVSIKKQFPCFPFPSNVDILMCSQNLVILSVKVDPYYEFLLVLLLINFDWYCHICQPLLMLKLGLPVFLGPNLLCLLVISCVVFGLISLHVFNNIEENCQLF